MMRTAVLRSPAGARVVLAGGILGLAEDGPRLKEFLDKESFDAVLLGIPFEDLDAIRATSGEEERRPFERDDTDDLYLKELERFGPVKVPPSDLYAAFAYAQDRKVGVEAIDLGDEGHTAVWTKNVGFFELVQNNRRLKRLPASRFTSTTPEEFAREWDEALFPTKGLRRVQTERETWMADRVVEFSKRHSSVFVLVPLARWPGVRQRLTSLLGFGPAEAGDLPGSRAASGGPT